MTIEKLLEVLEKLQHANSASGLINDFNTLQSLQQPNRIIQSSDTLQVTAQLDRIISVLRFDEYQTLYRDEHTVLDRLGFATVLGDRRQEFLENLKRQVQENAATAQQTVQSVIKYLSPLVHQPSQIKAVLGPLQNTATDLSENESAFEIIFAGDTEIDDFGEAKHQINDWYLIIEGYARLLGTSREEFEIISISKASPVRIKVKSSLPHIALVLQIIASTLEIRASIAEREVQINRLKAINLVADSGIQAAFIAQAESEIEKKVEQEIAQLVDEKVKEYNHGENQGDVRTAFAKSVENQYVFIANGGDINFNVFTLDQSSLERIATSKKKIKELSGDTYNPKQIK